MQVSALEPGDARAAGELLAASHADYPAFRALFPDPIVRRRMLRPFMTAAARDAARFGAALIARDEAQVVGVALWTRPGNFPLTAARKARMTPGLLRAALAAPRSFPAFARVGAALERDAPDEPSWYLQAMGVRPGVQRRGVGRRLIEPVLERADATGEPCHLHTSDPANVGYYRRYGFEVTGHEVRAFPGAPPYTGMHRAGVSQRPDAG